jgi:hypothetical protein
LKETGRDPKVIAEIRETEGDSLDLVELTVALKKPSKRARRKTGKSEECTGEICFSNRIGPQATAGG